ncbi:MAG: ribbon-helix-helix protein, CopG family [Chloroflexi bacterium]|nr:MAG: ribbon-helix-helix protein, CopG family [Chloroflexota bacterium]TMB80071.1 MAG: ribbon-helix-helix protein, CopG family [Chloroflexota bacterium]TMB97829.1 MAG: ribbon-helix-helix protein, CopG family [Chloroflexota bacterium]TMC25995.1 MAG: ribbon-helix-helix protein, CopG family [Chloroflexota bacterium]TMC33892.1 MAG: ribbon-helix-helix protein, CopG family [Chloroflexota bacterium]
MTLCYIAAVAAPRTVTISLPPALAREVDRVARAERRSRSELLREAFRQYVARLERWERIFTAGTQAARRAGVTEADVLRVVAERRRSSRAR